MEWGLVENRELRAGRLDWRFRLKLDVFIVKMLLDRDADLLALPFEGEGSNHRKSCAMKITQVICQVLRIDNVEAKTASSQDAVLVRVRTDTGLEGIGEADASPEVVKAVIDAPFSHNVACGLREILIGENPLETERLWQKMYRRTMYFGRTSVTVAAMAAVDLALWDIKGKHFGEPIHRLLGGKQHDKIKAYASILFGRDGKETADIGRRWIEAGYQAVKFGWEPMGESEAVDIDLVRGAREGVGDATLLIDAGCVWDARTALARAKAFADYGIGWLEEPLQQNDIQGYVWLRDRSPVAIAAGEGECGSESFRPYIDAGALDVYQVDLCRCGFTEGSYLIKRVQEIGRRLCNHCYTTPINVAAGVHWLSTSRDAFLFEDCVEDSALRHQLTNEKVQAEDGYIVVPDRPGLGVTLNEEVVAAHLVCESGN
jgi:L-alanine-DL-glutamate epimerase-like enolase superfamily enzyme